MTRKTVLVAGKPQFVPNKLKESLEARFGKNRYLVLFAKDHAAANRILQQQSVNVFILDGIVQS